ncbi:MAG: B12-binding domain-containing radical SAM protein [Candidatus Helarchaeota archaeon]|nr:B12-binding domain-containing radical SAM protein [Candidatus Helarchaeota archaeon]
MTEKKDILFILPPVKPMIRSLDLVYTYFEKISSQNKMKLLPIPNGIMSIGSLLEHEGYAIAYYDFIHFESKKNLSDLIKMLIQKHDPKIVGGYAYTPYINGLKKAFQIFKQINPEIITIAGGPHVTFLDIQTIKEFNGALDVVVRGEGEFTTLELVNKIIKGKNYTDILGTTNSKKSNPRRNLLTDEELANLPAININLIPKSELKKPLYFSIHCSRGCTYNCTFCANPHFWNRKLRFRSINVIIDEIRKLNEKYNVFFDFGDTNLPLIKNFKELVKEICELTFNNSLGMVLMRANLVNDSRLDLLKKMLTDHPKSYITIGVENASDKILKNMRKPSWNIQYTALKKVKKYNLDSIPSWMIGFPGESIETMTHNLKCLNYLNKSNLIQTAICFIFIPTPGTEPFSNPEKFGIKMTTKNWDFFDRAVFPPPYSLINEKGELILSNEQIWAYFISIITLQKKWRFRKYPQSIREIEPERFLNYLKTNPLYYNVNPTESDITTYEDYGGKVNNIIFSCV